jgi:hypothetical protein
LLATELPGGLTRQWRWLLQALLRSRSRLLAESASAAGGSQLLGASLRSQRSLLGSGRLVASGAAWDAAAAPGRAASLRPQPSGRHGAEAATAAAAAAGLEWGDGDVEAAIEASEREHLSAQIAQLRIELARRDADIRRLQDELALAVACQTEPWAASRPGSPRARREAASQAVAASLARSQSRGLARLGSAGEGFRRAGSVAAAAAALLGRSASLTGMATAAGAALARATSAAGPQAAAAAAGLGRAATAAGPQSPRALSRAASCASAARLVQPGPFSAPASPRSRLAVASADGAGAVATATAQLDRLLSSRSAAADGDGDGGAAEEAEQQLEALQEQVLQLQEQLSRASSEAATAMLAAKATLRELASGVARQGWEAQQAAALLEDEGADLSRVLAMVVTLSAGSRRPAATGQAQQNVVQVSPPLPAAPPLAQSCARRGWMRPPAHAWRCCWRPPTAAGCAAGVHRAVHGSAAGAGPAGAAGR